MKFFDIAFYLVFGYSIYDVITNWGFYTTCNQPLHIWLIVDLVLLLSFKEVMSFISDTQNDKLFKICLGFLGVIILPSIIYWSLQGTIWLFMVQTRTPECLNNNLLGMLMYTWLFICYCIVFLFGYGIYQEATRYYKQNRLRNRVENILNNLEENLLENPEEINDLLENGLLEEDNFGLKRGEIKQLKSEILEKIEIESLLYKECTICFDEFKSKDQVTHLPGCKHIYHFICIEHWLKCRPVCPNCNQNVRQEIFKKLALKTTSE